MKEGDSINFQKASVTLDGCIKVYSSRIDSVSTETNKLLTGLATASDDAGTYLSFVLFVLSMGKQTMTVMAVQRTEATTTIPKRSRRRNAYVYFFVFFGNNKQKRTLLN